MTIITNNIQKPPQETILLVDDNPTNLHVLYQTLQGQGYKLLLAKSGQDALSIIEKVHPALVLLDIMMPEMDGYQVCQQIKSTTLLSDTIIIFLSALDEVKDKIKGFDSGAVDYIAKPFQAEEVIARVVTHLKIRQLEHMLAKKNAQLKKDNVLILESMAEGLIGLDQQANINFINPAALNLIGYLEDEVIGRNIHQLLMHTDEHGQRNPIETNAILNTLGDKKIRDNVQAYFWHKNATLLPVEFTVSAIDSTLELSSTCVVFRDITQRKQREIALNQALVKVEQLKEELQQENKNLRAKSDYLQEVIRKEHNYGEIIGNSDALQKTMEEVQQVAQTDTTVLINGESGTGKESIARAIHQYSPRKDHSLIKVNCGAIAESLIESELFGHVKGAFTSAIQDRSGHFELADKGTIFLDEIGELPLDAQVKLLRVLQEQEVQRVGSSEVIHVDVRVIAATNRDLKQMVDEGLFRMDLYYRLNVFPITVPALRDRTSDIPLLTQHFIHQLSHKLSKPLLNVSAISMDLLMDYHWPGNIRELQNVLERSAILSKTENIEIDDGLIPVKTSPAQNSMNHDLSEDSSLPSNKAYKTLAENEKDYIIRLLNEHNWLIGGKKGVAEILDVPSSTLRSRMKKLGIERPEL